MLRALAILLLAASPALAQESARYLTTGVACWQSNAIAWEPATDPNGDALIYEVYRERPDGDWELCGQTVLTSLRLAGTPCYGRLAVRACDPGGLCSPHLSAPVEAWPCSCIACGTPECGVPGAGGGWCTCPDAYEYPCWDLAPLRLPHLPTGPPPVLETANHEPEPMAQVPLGVPPGAAASRRARGGLPSVQRWLPEAPPNETADPACPARRYDGCNECGCYRSHNDSCVCDCTLDGCGGSVTPDVPSLTLDFGGDNAHDEWRKRPSAPARVPVAVPILLAAGLPRALVSERPGNVVHRAAPGAASVVRESAPDRPPKWAGWAAVGAIALDYYTTRQALDRGAREASPLGPEGGVVLRLGIVWAADRWAARRPGTAVTLAFAGLSLGAAIHNHGVNR